jgi:transcriptional regulator with XRE-family HTH domain
MTTATEAAVPVWDLPDRLRKALREAGLTAGAMARYLEVDRNTVGRWLNDQNRPPATAIRMWAMLTGVDYEWLKGDAFEIVRRQGLEPRTRWLRHNPPADPRLAAVVELRPSHSVAGVSLSAA